jgi:hypothetical protein
VSVWRRTALERFPQLQQEINDAASVRDMWSLLKREFDRAHSHDEPQVIRAIHQYALWMIAQSRSAELAQAALDALYRPLLQENWASEDWDERLPALELNQHLTDEELAALYWEHLHRMVPVGRQREFIAELGIGKPPRKM